MTNLDGTIGDARKKIEALIAATQHEFPGIYYEGIGPHGGKGTYVPWDAAKIVACLCVEPSCPFDHAHS